jgi:outer membrane protein assembly factor BamD (BamD/ComL family)
MLTEEVAAILSVRAALRQGQAARALALLDDHDRRFPRGTLGIEVELLRIEALALSGATGEARARAQRFIALHPDTPYVRRARVHAGAGGDPSNP